MCMYVIDVFIVSSFDRKIQLPFHGYHMLCWRNQWTMDRAIFTKHIVVMKTWWRIRTLASEWEDMNFLLHYAIFFYINLKQLTLFLQVICLGKSEVFSKFRDSAQANC